MLMKTITTLCPGCSKNVHRENLICPFCESSLETAPAPRYAETPELEPAYA